MKKVLALIIALPLLVIGAEWQTLNGPPAGRADDMSMGYDPYIPAWVIYAADQTHKLYKSVNEGGLWDSILPLDVINPICVITDESNAQVVYIGKNADVPVWKSENGGQTWESKSYGIINTRPRCFAMDPNNSSIVYLGCKSFKDKPVLFRTNDGGFEWHSLNLSGYDINDILVLFLPDDGIVLILATDKGILRGKPYGKFDLTEEGAFELLKYDKKINKIFAQGNDKICQSSDGKSWQVYQSDEPIDFSGITDIIKQRRR